MFKNRNARKRQIRNSNLLKRVKLNLYCRETRYYDTMKSHSQLIKKKFIKSAPAGRHMLKKLINNLLLQIPPGLVMINTQSKELRSPCLFCTNFIKLVTNVITTLNWKIRVSLRVHHLFVAVLKCLLTKRKPTKRGI